MKRILAGFATAASLGAGGIVVDEQINPYEDKGPKLEIVTESTHKDAGIQKVELEKDRPAVTLKKWNDEATLTVVYDKVKGEGDRQLFTDRMEWKDGGNEEVHAYPLEAKEGMEDGGFEIEVYLKEKPDTNTFDFKIEGAEELDFFYQPELTPEEIAEGASRPENVIGSYAVYHKTKANHKLGQTNYATGKAFHIYRPKAFDADGNEQWAELSYREGVLTVTVPQDWLDKAAYPVIVDPTFGYTTLGASATALSANQAALHIATASENGSVISMSVWVRSSTGLTDIKGLLVSDSLVLLSNGVGDSADVHTTTTPPGVPITSYFSTPPSVVAATDYYLGIVFGTANPTGVYYDTVTSGDGKFHSNNFATPVDPTGATDGTQGWSIYATYDCTGCSSTHIFSAPGSHVWTAPTGVTSVDAACWGGGGGAGDGNGSGGGGGGGGAFASSTVAVTPGTSYNIVVGDGGVSNSSQTAGTNGGTSTFATTSVVAAPGWGGRGASGVDNAGGLGGAVASSTGTVRYAGGVGGIGRNTNDTGGGGGGAAGPNGAGGAGAPGNGTAGQGGGGGGGNGGSSATTVTGGASTNGGAGGNGGNVSAGSTGTSNSKGGGGGGGGDNSFGGSNGASVGAGGGGGEANSSSLGNGASGQCTITYTIAAGGGETPEARALLYIRDTFLHLKNGSLYLKN